MFFGYPISATAENWLHECLCAMVTKVHESLNAGARPPVWPNIVPATYRARLQSRTGLRDRLRRYTQAIRRLTPSERARLLTCLAAQNAIAELVGARSDCECLTDFPVPVRKPVADLFGFAFGLLSDLGVRDRHYAAIYNGTTEHVCPFCASEYFDAPGAPREDLDHYLAFSRYPFAAANLRNLSPMGIKCNERYKLAVDILTDAAGNRRRSFNPYAERRLRVSLTNSVPFGQDDGQTPAWHIDFVPESTECVTWDDVFSVRQRISRDVLNPSFLRWLGDFAAWFVIRKGLEDLSDEKIMNSLREYWENAELTGLTAREFLRAPVFQMLEHHCRSGNARLLALMRSLFTHAVLRPPATT